MTTLNAITSPAPALVTTVDSTGNLVMQAVNSIQLQSGSNTATMPAAAGTVMVSGNMPAFSAYSSSQSLTGGSLTKLACNTKDFDTNNCYDAITNYRFTPTVAGYYQMQGRIEVSTTNATLRLIPYKNGAALLNALFSTYPSNFDTISAVYLVYCNGSTDYLEMYGQVGSSQNCYVGFQAFMVRAA